MTRIVENLVWRHFEALKLKATIYYTAALVARGPGEDELVINFRFGTAGRRPVKSTYVIRLKSIEGSTSSSQTLVFCSWRPTSRMS